MGASSTYDQSYMSQTLALPYYATQGIERPPVSYRAIGQPCYAAQFTARPTTPYPDLELNRLLLFCFEDTEAVLAVRHAMSQTLRKLTEVGLLTALTPRPPPQSIPPQFRMDLALWDDTEPEPIMLDGIYEMDKATLGPRVPTPFILIPNVEDVQASRVDDPQTLDVQYILRGSRVLRQPPP
ncbi:hypothetical protein CK203_046462 [Vitis vinifera]|uniref:Uncharacterized protein n=1 Tax=Vitis vinifera TaxID=29760 RepID=A0A438I1W0_VITVI|nr:hypothetical protein CK203_046462 [Vitis vinifera]